MSNINRLLLTLCGGIASAFMVPGLYLLLSSDYELSADSISTARYLKIVLWGIAGCIITLTVTTVCRGYSGNSPTWVLALTAVAISFALLSAILIISGLVGVPLASYSIEIRNLLTMIAVAGLLYVSQDRLMGN